MSAGMEGWILLYPSSAGALTDRESYSMTLINFYMSVDSTIFGWLQVFWAKWEQNLVPTVIPMISSSRDRLNILKPSNRLTLFRRRSYRRFLFYGARR
jgi:hypothetical protein